MQGQVLSDKERRQHSHWPRYPEPRDSLQELQTAQLSSRTFRNVAREFSSFRRRKRRLLGATLNGGQGLVVRPRSTSRGQSAPDARWCRRVVSSRWSSDRID